MSETIEIDLVTAEVIRSAMETVCFEMATYVSRTATTPILNQSNERNATILDGQGRLAALSVGIPQFMLSSTLPVRFAIDFFGDELKPGDVIVANDPYHGGGHLPDFNVFAPVFDDEGELLLVASIQCHHGDTGGAVRRWLQHHGQGHLQRGHALPAAQDHRRRARAPGRRSSRCGPTTGSPASSATSAPRSGRPSSGAARLRELAAHYGRRHRPGRRRRTPSTTPGRRFSDEISGWPDGTYEADIYVDSDPQGNQDLARAHRRHRRRRPADPRLRRVRRRVPTSRAWSTFGNTRGNAIAQLASLVDPSIPKNEGFFDCVELRVPLGCCLNPEEPKPVSSGTHHPGVEVGDAIAVAMAQIIPERCAPQTYKFGSPRQMWGDVDPRTGQSVLRPRRRGQRRLGQRRRRRRRVGRPRPGHGQPHQGVGRAQRAALPAHPAGPQLPDRLGRPRQVPGRLRQPLRQGGPHADLDQPVRASTSATSTRASPADCRAAPTSASSARGPSARSASPPSVTAHLLETGDQLVYDFGGGGGWGDPLERDVEAVLDDVWDEYVSVEGAAARLRRRHHRARSRPWTSPSTTTATKRLRAERSEAGRGMSAAATATASASTSGGPSPTACCSARRVHPAGEDADHARGPVRRRARRHRRAWPRRRAWPTSARCCGQRESIVHGTTAADNTMIQMTGAPTGLLVTEGFRDEIEMRRCFKEDIWDPELPGAGTHRPPPGPPRGRRARHERGRRSTASSTRRACARRRRGCAPSASRRSPSCFLHSYLNPSARAARPGDHPRGVPRRRAGLAVARGVAEATRVRAHVHHPRQRLRGTADRPLPRPPRVAPARRRIRRGAAAGHQLGRRRHPASDQDAAARHHRLRARPAASSRRRGACCGGRARRRRQRRHGRHQLRRLPDPRRPARGEDATGTGGTATASPCRWSTCTPSAPAEARSAATGRGTLTVGPESAGQHPGTGLLPARAGPSPR